MKNIKTLQSLPGKQSGLSMIELMVASVIGLFVLAGAVTIFSSNNASSSMSSGMSRLQDSGRVALDIVANSVRMAGYEGCRSASKASPTVLASTAPVIDLPDTAIWGSEVNGSSLWDPSAIDDLDNIDGLAKEDSSVIYLQHASGRSTNLNIDMTNIGAPSVEIASNPDQLVTNEMIMIANCSNAHIFRATNIGTGPGGIPVTFGAQENTQGNLGVIYEGTGFLEDSPLRVMRFESSAYFIQDSQRDMPNGDPIYSLYALDTTTSPIGNAVELIEGVEQMHILYGERVGATGNIRYVTADEVDNMSNVASVQIGILIATANYAGSDRDERTYNVAGVTVGPPGAGTDLHHAGDRRLRAAFNTTIQLRNRTPL